MEDVNLTGRDDESRVIHGAGRLAAEAQFRWGILPVLGGASPAVLAHCTPSRPASRRLKRNWVAMGKCPEPGAPRRRGCGGEVRPGG